VSEMEKASVLEMLGEFLREAAVLVLVFVPLELYKPGASDFTKVVSLHHRS